MALRQEYETPKDVLADAGQVRRKSVSRQMAERFERRKIWRRFVALFYIGVMATYLSWRFTIINPDSLFLSITYFAADMIGFILGITTIITSWSYSHREPTSAPPGLSVDVLVPTYKEPLNIIRRTVMAAKAIDYPHNTFLLDDGRRDEVRALAAELGVRYLRRPDNTHAKAGNLNYGLAHSKADFVMTFDADHIALPHALDIMLGFFRDENVAMVQTPQDYYNIDAFPYMNDKSKGALWYDQSYFYNVVQSCGDSVNAATCVGTGVVYRRSAIDDIGGIPTETVTEDIHTSLKLHKRGYKTVFLNEPVAYGVAAADLAEYYKTRHRWAHGNLHAVRLENILFCKGLNWRQRFQYLALELVLLEGWQQLLLFVIPVMSLVFGLQPFKITIFNVLFVLGFPFFSYMLLREISCGFSRYWAGEMFAMTRWPIYVSSCTALFGRSMPWRSSAKNIKGQVDWRLMAPQLTVLAVSIAALGIALVRLHGHYETGPLFQFIGALLTRQYGVAATIDVNAVLAKGYTVDLVAIAGAWAAYSAGRAVFFVRKVIRDARKSRAFFRFSIPLPAVINARARFYGCITCISEDWARLVCYGDAPLPSAGDFVDLTVFLPAGPLGLKIAVESVKGREIEGHLVWSSPRQQDQLANGLYSVDWHREFLHRTAYFPTPSDIVLSYLLLQSPLERKHGRWQALLYGPEAADRKHYGILADILKEGGYASLITFQPFSPGDSAAGMIFSGGGTRHAEFTVMNEEPLASLVQKGLDGASVRRYRVRLIQNQN